LIDTLSSAGFRNLDSQALAFAPGLTLLVGDNGEGKTNVLEALCVLSGRPSFRGATPAEMAAGDTFWVRGRILGPSGQDGLSMEWIAGKSRVFRRGEKAISFARAGRLFPAVFLAPEDREIFLGPPGVRRRFLDRLAVSLFPAAAEEHRQFRRALDQRNAAIAQASPSDAMESWTEELVRRGAAVRARRHEALHAFSEPFCDLLDRAGSVSGLEMAYSGAPGPAEEAEEHYAREARRLRSAETSRGHTLFGPQREDLVFTRSGRPFAASASSGEVLRAAFLLRLAEGRAVERTGGETPLIAIDDFDADLSPRSAEALLAEVSPLAQAVLTTTRPEAAACFPREPDAVYRMEGGRAVARPTRATLRKIG